MRTRPGLVNDHPRSSQASYARWIKFEVQFSKHAHFALTRCVQLTYTPFSHPIASSALLLCTHTLHPTYVHHFHTPLRVPPFQFAPLMLYAARKTTHTRLSFQTYVVSTWTRSTSTPAIRGHLRKAPSTGGWRTALLWLTLRRT